MDSIFSCTRSPSASAQLVLLRYGESFEILRLLYLNFYLLNTNTDTSVFAIVQKRSPSPRLFGSNKRCRTIDSDDNLRHVYLPEFDHYDPILPDVDESDTIPRYEQLSPVWSQQSPTLTQDLEHIADGVRRPIGDFQRGIMSLTGSPTVEQGGEVNSAQGSIQWQPPFCSGFGSGLWLNNLHTSVEYRAFGHHMSQGSQGDSAYAQGFIAPRPPRWSGVDLDSNAQNEGEFSRNRVNTLLDSLGGTQTFTEHQEPNMLKNLTDFLGKMARNDFYEQCKELEQQGRLAGVDSFTYSASSGLKVVPRTRNDLKMLSMLLLKLAEPDMTFVGLIPYISAAYNALILGWQGSTGNDANKLFQNQYCIESLRKSARSMYATVDSWSPTLREEKTKTKSGCQFKTLAQLRDSLSPDVACVAQGIALFAYQRHEEHKRRAKGPNKAEEISLLEAVRPDKVARLAQTYARAAVHSESEVA